MARDGMTNLIRRLRQMTESSASDYTLNSETYWSDDHLQSVLDGHRTRFDHVRLEHRPEYVNGVHIYMRYELPKGINAVEGISEEDSSGFRVMDYSGAEIDPDIYTLNERDMSIVFDEDQEGAPRYWSGFAYDLQAAAREIWLIKAAHSWTAINFSVDWQRFDREALFKHCNEMAARFGHEQGSKVTRLVRSDVAARRERELF